MDKGSRMRTNIGMCLAAILFILSASPVAAQSPAGAQDDGGQTGAGESLLIDRIDPERLRLPFACSPPRRARQGSRSSCITLLQGRTLAGLADVPAAESPRVVLKGDGG